MIFIPALIIIILLIFILLRMDKKTKHINEELKRQTEKNRELENQAREKQKSLYDSASAIYLYSQLSEESIENSIVKGHIKIIIKEIKKIIEEIKNGEQGDDDQKH